MSEDFFFWFFSWNIFPQVPENNIRVASNFSKIRGYIRKSSPSISDTGGKFFTGQLQGWQFSTGINNTGSNFPTGSADFLDTGGKFSAGVIATGVNDIGGK
jgi:hypothetical protein